MRWILSIAVLSFFCMAGCGRGGGAPAEARLTGTIFGGQQPVSGASVQLYAVGTNGDQSAATALLSPAQSTNANGQFTLTGLYTCPTPASLIYLVGTGGNPGLGSGGINPQLGLIAALGPCSGLTSSTYLQINEVTTVAAIYALAPFLASASAVGSSSADAGQLANAFTLAGQIANLATGQTPGANLPTGTVVPTAQVNTLADILAVCINTGGGKAGDGSPCGTLFSLTTPPGMTAPTNAIGALLNLAENPAMNTAALYEMAPPTSPYQPFDSVTPADLSIVFTTAALQVSPATGVVMPTTTVGSVSSSEAVTIANVGSTALALNSLTLSGADASEFSQSNNCPATLAPNASCMVTIRFSPSSGGLRGTYLLVSSSAGESSVSEFVSGMATTTSGGGTANPGGSPIAALVDLPFNDASGTVAHDASGNNNNCTLQTSSGRTPAWSALGLNFAAGQGCDLPATANTVQTWCFAFNAPDLPATSNFTANYVGLLFSNIGNGQQGLNLLTQYGGAQAQNFIPDTYGATILSGSESPLNPAYGYIMTSSNDTFVGTNRLCYVLGTPGTSVDHVYLNGVETSGYGVQNASAGLQTSSFLSLGSSNTAVWSGSGGPETLYHALGYASALTPAQVQTVDQFLATDLNQRQVATVPALTVASTPQLLLIGDSITVGYGLHDPSTVWWKNLTLANQPARQEQLFAISGLTALALGGSEPYRAAKNCSSTQGPSVVTLWNGTNDLEFLAGAGPELTFQNIATEIDRLSSAGCEVLVFTTLSRAGNAADGGNFESERNLLNLRLLEQAKAMGAFGVVDVNAIPYFGATGANANPVMACFSDGTHPSDACEPLIAQTVSNSMNYYFGSTAQSPTVYTSGTTLLSGDRVTDVSGCTSSCSFTLPDGTGPSGEMYTIVTGGAPTTVQGIHIYGYTQTVNGSASPVTLKANSTVKLLIVPLPQATSGVEWVIQ